MDVGEDAFEEITDMVAGGDGGWPAIEGYAAAAVPLPAAYVEPLYAFDHSQQARLGGNLPAACCVTGGATCDSTSFPPAWLGAFFFVDLCGGWIAALPASSAGGAAAARGAPKPTPQLFARGFNTPQSITFGPDGALYVISHNDGAVHRVAYAPLAAPAVSQQPASARVPLGQPVSFSVSVASAAPVAYQWQRAAPGSAVFVNVAAGTASIYTAPPATFADDGARFRVSATSSHGYVMSASALLGVMNNLPPEAYIDSPPMLPADGLAYSNASAGYYVAGDVFVFAARGVDNTSPRGPAPVPSANISFNVYLLHNTHRHDFAIGVPGPNLTLTTPLEGEGSPHQAYEVVATVADSNGAVAVATSIIYPVLSTLTVTTLPAGADVLVNNAAHATPFTLSSVAGITALLAPAPAGAAAFLGWADQAPLDASVTQRAFALPPGTAALVMVLLAPSVQPTPLSPTASASASAAPPESQFAGRSSSGATAAQQQLGVVGVLARLALAIVAAEVVRRLA